VTAAAVLAACGGSTQSSAVRASRRKPVPTSSTTTTTRPPFSYQVRSGDTLTSLAGFFGVSLDALAFANHLTVTSTVDVGQTLTIPSRAAVQLSITPTDGPAGTPFTLSLTGAQPGELIFFRVTGPDDNFTGLPHGAAPDGSVSTTYTSDQYATPGHYTVTVIGNRGTTVKATFVIDNITSAS